METPTPVMKKISRNHKPKLSPCLTFACADEWGGNNQADRQHDFHGLDAPLEAKFEA